MCSVNLQMQLSELEHKYIGLQTQHKDTLITFSECQAEHELEQSVRYEEHEKLKDALNVTETEN